MSKLIVLSADAMVYEDLEFLQTLPNFKRLMSNCSIIKNVRSIYPTITYPAHTTIATGAYPNKHGITGNNVFTKQIRNKPWLWFHDAVKTDDIFTAAKKKGLSTAAVFWPVTGNHPNIDYLIDEYWTQGENDSFYDAFKRTGSADAVLEIIGENAPLLIERKHPMCDEFVIGCACDMITWFKPDLLMIHPANIDAYRHQKGVFNDYVKAGVIETDQYIGQIINATKIAGIYEETNFVLVSDHGQIDIKRTIHPNIVFAENGLISPTENGEIYDWKAMSVSGGASALIYLKDRTDKETYEKTYLLLKKMRDDGIYGISEIYTHDEINEKEHLGGDFAFVIETDGYTSFGDNVTGNLVTGYDNSDYRFGKGTHGYHPDKGPQPIFAAKGPDFRENVVLDKGLLVDEAPTFAKILGLDLPNADGKPVNEIIREELV